MTVKQKITFIINPAAGRRKKDKLPFIIEKNIDKRHFDYEIHITKGPGHAQDLSRQAVRHGCTMIVACGGDGTTNEVARAMIGTHAVLGIIPAGSGNGLARHLKIPLLRAKAVRMLNSHRVITADTATLNGRLFVNVAGIGFDAHIAHLFPKLGHRGPQGYTKLVLKEFYRYKSKEYLLRYNGTTKKQKAFFIAFANGSQFGSGTTIAPRAKLDDGLLDLCILKNFHLIKAPVLIGRMFFNIVDRSPLYSCIKSDEIVVKIPDSGKNQTLVHLDGEPVMLNTDEIHLKVAPHSIRIAVPHGGKYAYLPDMQGRMPAFR